MLPAIFNSESLLLGSLGVVYGSGIDSSFASFYDAVGNGFVVYRVPFGNALNAGIEMFRVDASKNIILGGALRRKTQNPAFSAAPTPDFTLGDHYQMGPLTGNVSVANPTNGAAGQSALLIWQQDGTGGRTVTYSGANWRSVGIAAQSTTLNTMTIDLVSTFDGTVWRVTRLVTGQTV
jgi:hypothetical protein